MWFTVVTGAVPRQILSRINAANTKVYEYLRTRCAVSWSCITFCCYVYGRRYSATRAFTSKVSLFFKLNVKRWRMCACHHSCVLLYINVSACVCVSVEIRENMFAWGQRPWRSPTCTHVFCWTVPMGFSERAFEMGLACVVTGSSWHRFHMCVRVCFSLLVRNSDSTSKRETLSFTHNMEGWVNSA